jgi:hypothetical protein
MRDIFQLFKHEDGHRIKQDMHEIRALLDESDDNTNQPD